MSLFELSANALIKHVSFVSKYANHIPSSLYPYLLITSVKNNRLLSTRSLYLSWPLQKLSLVNCVEFNQQSAMVLAKCLETGCSKIREVDLTGCNIGVHGTAWFLMLIAGKPLPDAQNYCSNSKTKKKLHRIGDLPQTSIIMDCYVDKDVLQHLKDVLCGNVIYNVTFSYFHVIELHTVSIRRILKMLGRVQNNGPIGINLEWNSIHKWELLDGLFRKFHNLKHLNLSMNSINYSTVLKILKEISSPLTHLNLSQCGLKHSGSTFGEMAQLPSTQNLELLDIGFNRISIIMEGLMMLLRWCSATLSKLYLEYTSLKDDSVPNILQLLRPPFSLKELDLANNPFSLTAARLLYRHDKRCIITAFGFYVKKDMAETMGIENLH